VNIPSEIRRRARLSGHFTLRSGATSRTYFDKYQFESDPMLLREIAREMTRLLPDATEILAGLEMGGLPVVTALSQATGIPAAFIRKEPKTYGTCRYAEGPEMKHRKVVLVEELAPSLGGPWRTRSSTAAGL